AARGNAVTSTATSTNGSTSEFGINTAVPPPRPANVAPTARFTMSCTHVTCTFDATPSTDPDGSIVRDQWSFGDGAPAEGATVQQASPAAGAATVTLTAPDNDAATDTVTHTAHPTNAAPVASFTVSCSFQVCSVDAGASSDADGDALGFAWDFGD